MFALYIVAIEAVALIKTGHEIVAVGVIAVLPHAFDDDYAIPVLTVFAGILGPILLNSGFYLSPFYIFRNKLNRFVIFVLMIPSIFIDYYFFYNYFTGNIYITVSEMILLFYFPQMLLLLFLKPALHVVKRIHTIIKEDASQ